MNVSQSGDVTRADFKSRFLVHVLLHETTFDNLVVSTVSNSMLHEERFNETCTIRITMLQVLSRFQKAATLKVALCAIQHVLKIGSCNITFESQV